MTKIASFATEIEINQLFNWNNAISGSWLARAQCRLPSPNAARTARPGADTKACSHRSGCRVWFCENRHFVKAMPTFYFSFWPSFPFIYLKLYAISRVYLHGFGFHQRASEEAIQKIFGGLSTGTVAMHPILNKHSMPWATLWNIVFTLIFQNIFLIEINKLKSKSFLPFFPVSTSPKAQGVGRKRFFQRDTCSPSPLNS